MINKLKRVREIYDEYDDLQRESNELTREIEKDLHLSVIELYDYFYSKEIMIIGSMFKLYKHTYSFSFTRGFYYINISGSPFKKDTKEEIFKIFFDFIKESDPKANKEYKEHLRELKLKRILDND